MAEITQEMWDELQADYDALSEAYEELRKNEEMYRVAVGLTNHTITVVDIESHTLNQIYNEGDFTGIAVSMPDVPESVISTGIIHPEDCEGYRQFYRDIYGGVPHGSFTVRVMEENRGWVWFTMYYQSVFDGKGKPLRAICFSDDITSQKTVEEKFTQYKNAVTAGAEFVWEINLTRDTIISNDQNTDEVIGDLDYSTYTELADAALLRVTDPVLREEVMDSFSREALKESYKNGRREVSMEYPFIYAEDTENGEARWMRLTAYLTLNNVGDTVAIFCSNDITDSHERIKKLEKLAEHDALTGLYNRFSFERRAKHIITDMAEDMHAFLMIDIDNFKLCNDTYGHSFGDQVLQMFAKVAKHVFRSSDLIGRVGGDEFMVVMSCVDSREIVLKRAKELKEAFCEEGEHMHLPPSVSLSIGITFTQSEGNYKKIYMSADELMYRAKKEGKDRISIIE